MSLRYLFADTTANHRARSRGTLVPQLVRISYSTTFLAMVHMYGEYYMFILCSQRTKKAFCDWLRYFVFVYEKAYGY